MDQVNPEPPIMNQELFPFDTQAQEFAGVPLGRFQVGDRHGQFNVSLFTTLQGTFLLVETEAVDKGFVKLLQKTRIATPGVAG